MFYLINICLLLLLATVVLQDFRNRLISWPLIPLLLVCFIAQGITRAPAAELLRNALFNLAFIALQLLALTLYISVKNKKIVNIADSHMGLGDILFFAVITTAFSPVNFIIFYTAALLLTFISYVIYISINKSGSKEIPLAGAMSLVMIVVVLVDCGSTGSFIYDDTVLTNLLMN
jgi:hypothetical protein